MAVPNVEITLAAFQDGYGEGYITDVCSLKIGAEWRVYGKDPRGMGKSSYRYKIVWARMP